jgi:Tfp pilus assembly protein PilF
MTNQKATEADSECPYVLTIGAIFSIFEGDLQKAQQNLDKARALQKNQRELLYYYFTIALKYGNITLALNYNLSLSQLYPHDIFNVRFFRIIRI